jgi:hypothetical protein
MIDQLPRKEVGKIAGLPKAVRDELNLQILNGSTLRACAQWLNGHGPADEVRIAKGWGEFNEENVSNWRQSGYATWEKARHRFDDLKLKAEARMTLRSQLEAEGMDMNDANTLRLVELADSLLDDFDPAALREAAKARPLAALQWLTDLAAKGSEGKRKERELELKVKRFEDSARAAKEKLQGVKRDGGLSEEARREIEEAVALL